MTALATAAPALAHRPPRQTRWLLRLHRPALLVWTALVVAVGAALLWLGGPLTDAAAEAWRQYNACHTAHCGYDQDAILRYKDWYNYTTYAVLALPFLTAAWSGGSLIGRELETGTAHLAWTQSVPPARWLAVRLAVPAALTATGTGLLVLLHHLMWSAGRGHIDTAKSWYDAGTFAANGTIVVALAVAGLVLGALAGLLWRRSLPALITAPLATGGLWALTSAVLPRLWPWITRTSTLDAGPKGVGIEVGKGLVTASGAHIPAPTCTYGDYLTCYGKLGAVGFYHDYHPQSHYWPLQLTGAALVLVLTALLTLLAFRLLRTRTGGTPTRKEFSA